MDVRVILFGMGAAALGYFNWRAGSRGSSLIRGTATSKIAFAAMGFAEVQGAASASVEGPLRDPITHDPCVWFEIETQKFSFLDKCRWRTVKRVRSSRSIVIDDGSGRCLVSPDGVAMDLREENTIVKDSWNLRHKLWWIREGDPIYAIGYLVRATDLATAKDLHSSGLATEPRGDIGNAPDEQALTERAIQILRDWKSDPKRSL